MNVQNISGFELLSAMKDGKIPYSSIAETIPMRIVKIEKGSIRFIVKADNRHLNPLGGVHGGFATTVLDSITGCAIHTLLEAGVGFSTVDINIKMLRPIPLNKEIHGEGQVLHISSNLGVSEGTIKDDNDKLYAHATCTCMILRDRTH